VYLRLNLAKFFALLCDRGHGTSHDAKKAWELSRACRPGIVIFDKAYLTCATSSSCSNADSTG